MVIKRFEVWLIDLEPVRGSEINKTRPCLVISPNVSNHYLNTVTVAAMASTIKQYPTRVNCVFKRKKGQVALDQIRSMDKARLVKKLGEMDELTNKKVSDLLVELFTY